jgi:hypothetical protein
VVLCGETGSGGRTRTYDQAVNSRPLSCVDRAGISHRISHRSRIDPDGGISAGTNRLSTTAVRPTDPGTGGGSLVGGISSVSNVPPRLRFEVFTRDGFRCTYCGRSARDGIELQADHIISVFDGGTTTLGNLTTACFECNVGKGSVSSPVIPLHTLQWGMICRTRLWVVGFGLHFGQSSYASTIRFIARIPRTSAVAPELPPRRRDDNQRWWVPVCANPDAAQAAQRWMALQMAEAINPP